MKLTTILFRTSAVLWLLWGLVHILAGIMTIKGILTHDISASIAGIADVVDPSSLKMDYPQAAGAVIGQHGFNLLWIGLVTLICALYIWNGKKQAIYLAALCGGLADLGYFLFLDLGGFVNFMPGSLMTIISSAAIILSFVAFSRNRKAGV